MNGHNWNAFSKSSTPPFQSSSMTPQVASENGDNSLIGQYWPWRRKLSATQSIPNYGGCEDGEMLLEYSESMNHPYELWEYPQNSGPSVTTANTQQPPITFSGYQTSNAEVSDVIHAHIAFAGSNSMVPYPDYNNTGVLHHAHGRQPPPFLDIVESHAYGPQNPTFAHPFIDPPVHSPRTRGQHDLGRITPSACSQNYRQLNFSAISTTAPPPPLPDEQPQHESQEDDEGSEPEPPHIRNWKMIIFNVLVVTGTRYFIPQYMYKPMTRTDQSRYVEEITFQQPIIFYVDSPHEWGIPLKDTRDKTRKNLTRLQGKDDLVLEGCGPSASIRIQWKGYGPWSRQISTQNYRKDKGPITRAKLVEHVAGCVSRFIDEMQNKRMEDDGDKRFRVGHGHIVAEDLILVSLHHISKGSWQPQLRLKRLPWEQA